MGSSKQTNTSSGTTSGTTNGYTGGTTYSSSNPNVPEWAQAAPQNFMQQANAFGQQLQQNPNMLATPANGLLQGAYTAAGNLPNGGGLGLAQSNDLALKAGTATAPSYTAPTIDALERAALVKAQAAQAGPAASLLDNFAAYANPVTDELVTKNLAALDAQQGQNTAQMQAQAARGGAFGGSRYGIAQAQLASQQAMDQGLLSANLRNNAFQQQAGLAEADTGRRQQTGLFNATNQQQTNLFNAGQANSMNQFNANAANGRASQQASLNAQGGMFNATSQQQQLDRALSAGGLLSSNAGLNSNIANNNLATQMAVGNNQMGIDRNNALAQLQGLQGYQGLLDPALYSQFVGQTNVGSATGYENSSQYGTMSGTETAKKKGGLLGTIGGALQAGASAAALFSDRRLKTDIRRVGQTDAGLPIYTYRYIGDDTPQMGVMAQEVEAMQPGALGPERSGFKTVIYSEVR